MQPVELALDAALLVTRNGGSTVAAERSFAQILKGFGEPPVPTVWRLDFIAASTGASAIVRPVGPIGVNLARASAVAVLGEAVAAGKVPAAAIEAEVDRIGICPRPMVAG
jgi:hypothetical protein